jgi:hypothetical protein
MKRRYPAPKLRPAEGDAKQDEMREIFEESEAAVRRFFERHDSTSVALLPERGGRKRRAAPGQGRYLR